MTTLASPTTLTRTPARHKVAGALLLPMGAMGCLGAYIFWSWGPDMIVGLIGLAINISCLVAGYRLLRGIPSGVTLTLRAAAAAVLFSLLKLVGWQEPEALLFGAVALAAAALVFQDRCRAQR